ncbi:uncharacterized protein LOC135129631 isoform X2 [Zophobas morio]|uniref:uncharacterized protein LOC135129631 isoform X2 n=1 Tax=Zophobas morio TaxID=2755281 RepID=UPI003083CFDA
MSFLQKTTLLMSVFILCVSQTECGVASNCRGNCTQELKGLSRADGGGEKEEKEDVMSKILPMMVMPFMLQVTMLPMMLMSMKFMLMKSMFLGKMAIVLGFVAFLRNLLKRGDALYSHNVNVHHHPEYSHHGRAIDFTSYEERNR